MYEWGAQSYNTTLVNDVENADIENMNVDRRAYGIFFQENHSSMSLQSWSEYYYSE